MQQSAHSHSRAFTLIELLVVIAIIGILSTAVFFAINDARVQSRDKARGVQLTELLKALELTYSDDGSYPDDGTPLDNTVGDELTNIGSGFIGGQFIKKLPQEPERYQYCVSADRASMMLAVNTENDRGSGIEYCSVVRGAGAGADGFGCTAWMNANALDTCLNRF